MEKDTQTPFQKVTGSPFRNMMIGPITLLLRGTSAVSWTLGPSQGTTVILYIQELVTLTHTYC